MNERRDGTRAMHARLFLTTIALAMACGRGDAPAAAGRGATAPPPHPTTTVDTTPPSGALGASVRRGRALLAATHDSLPSHAGSSLRCFSCHLDEGHRAGGLSLVGAYARYPQYRPRRARVDLIEDRVNDCFIRSLNGHAIPADGNDMRDIVTYLWWLARGVAVGDSATATSVPALATLSADTARGAQIFAQSCARCHGANGQGAGVAPPVWGAKSYNIGAGMARYRMAAPFVLRNMPFDKPNTLTPQQALDVARYIDTRPRPDLAGKEYDWPTGERPNDVPYPTRPGSVGGADTARTRAHSGALTSAQDIPMNDDILTSSPRRTFLGRVAAGTAALGLTAFLPVTACAAEKTVATASDSTSGSAEPSEWPGAIKTKHKMAIDVFAVNQGFPLAFAYTFGVPYASVTPSPATAVVVLRHEGFPLALTDAIWAKYKIGKTMNIIDPATKKPAERNPFYNAKPGSLFVDDMGIDKLMAKGTIFGACNVALHFMSAQFAPAGGVTPEVALKEWTAGIIPGIPIIPSGTWGVNRAQEVGCTYCAGA